MPSLADLIRMGKQYVSDALPGGTLNSEVNRQGILDGAALSTTAVPVLGDLLGLGADVNRYATDPESRTAGNFALSGLGMLPFVPAMTAWHGSPHKFDKFSLDKIGTGEGAQAYGHGLYLAEAPEVAQTYGRSTTPGNRSFNSVDYNGQKFPAGSRDGELLYDITTKGRADVIRNLQAQADRLATINPKESANLLSRIEYAKTVKPDAVRIDAGNLYKTDIPDEAVARFLDWDKPLSQQAPEVQAAIGRLKNANPSGYQKLVDAQLGGPLMEQATGRDLYQSLGRDAFNDSGIPGIRYLDGGSRSAGQGSSNFVAFDPEMIRILERNGQATGAQPWKPGEYRLKDLIPK